jgi:site-specific DNA-methyltransferase (adenine-specific)
MSRQLSDRVECADNLAFMSDLPDGCCGLIYIDPPFNTGRPRRMATGDQTYQDNWKGGVADYLAFLRPRLEQCRRLLAAYGTLYVHLDWHVSHHVRVILDELMGVECFLNEIIWHYRTGGVSKRWFGRKHDTILSYARQEGEHYFLPIREGEYRTDGLNYDEKGRPYKSTKNGRLYFDPAGPLLSDVWDMPFLSTVSLERVDWPTQKPLALLERIIKASSREGDVVGDFFCGSGTTLVAARRLGRGYVGCDIEPEAVEIARQRLASVAISTDNTQEQLGLFGVRGSEPVTTKSFIDGARL